MRPTEMPSPFAQLLGQQRAKSLLGRSLSSGRIAHAYLFRGPDGVGKKLFAQAMAKALNCRSWGPAGACDQCISCRKFLSGNHPDYSVESPEKGTIKIERMRQLCKSLAYPPYESERRVIVIEDIHTMRAEAANNLLKTLEEPPPGNVLILTVEASRSILPTIISRCQVIPFSPLSPAETMKVLQNVPDLDVDEERSLLLARLSEGSPGRALLLHRSHILETWRKVEKVLDNPAFREDRYAGGLLEVAGQMAELKENLLPLLGLLRIRLRDRLVSRLDNKEAGRGQDASMTLFSKLQAIDRAEQELARNCNRSLVCEILLFRLQ